MKINLPKNVTMKFTSAGIFLFIKFQFFPSTSLLFWMAVAIGLDFITGVAKAASKGQARTSEGYRKTVIKAFQYMGALTAGVILANAGIGTENEHIKSLLMFVNDGLVVFIIFIEITSVFENLVELDKGSMISKYFFTPALRLLTFQIKNNPVAKSAKELPTKDAKVTKDTTV